LLFPECVFASPGRCCLTTKATESMVKSKLILCLTAQLWQYPSQWWSSMRWLLSATAALHSSLKCFHAFSAWPAGLTWDILSSSSQWLIMTLEMIYSVIPTGCWIHIKFIMSYAGCHCLLILLLVSSTSWHLAKLLNCC